MTDPKAWDDEAAAAYAAKDMVRLEAIGNEILKSYATDAQALQMIFVALCAQGRFPEAMERYRSALDLLHRMLAPTQLVFGLQLLRSLGFQPRGILDIGAFEGGFAHMARTVWPQSPILMLEAQPGKEPLLKTAAAQLPEVDYRIVLLGPESRSNVPFHHVNAAVNSSGSSLYEEQTSYPRETAFLTMRTLDAVVAEIPGIDFNMLKIDVQGAEIDVLRGGARTLAGIEAIIIEMSLLEYNKGTPLIGDVTAWLGDAGFALFDMFPLTRTQAGALLQIDAIFLRRNSGLWPKAPFF